MAYKEEQDANNVQGKERVFSHFSFLKKNRNRKPYHVCTNVHVSSDCLWRRLKLVGLREERAGYEAAGA
jgi:hypothetical protein